LAFVEAEHGGLGKDETPANNIRRKKLYLQLTLLLNDGPLGISVFERSYRAVALIPSVKFFLPKNFMGFKSE
jgi:hypothetical protein